MQPLNSKLFRAFIYTITMIYTSYAFGAEIPSIEELATAYDKKAKAIKIILLDTSKISQTTLVDQEDLWRFYHTMPFMQSTTTLVYDDDGRFYQAARNHWGLIEQAVHKDLQSHLPGKSQDAPSFDAFQKAVEKELLKVSNEPMPAVITIFDGKNVWTHREAEILTRDGVARKSYSIRNPESEQLDLIPETLLDYLLVSPCVYSLPKANKKRLKNYLPDMLASGDYTISSKLHEIAGNPCVLVNSLSQSIWLDPQFGFAVRRRVWRYKDGKTIYEIEADHFKEILPGVLWLPRTVLARQYGVSEIAEGRFAGVPLFENVTEINKVEINQPTLEKYFSLDIPPGSWVVDATLTALDSDGNEIVTSDDTSVSYIQPADQADLEQVIREARLESGQPPPQKIFIEKKNVWSSVLIWFNVGVLSVILLLLGYRKFISRSAE